MSEQSRIGATALDRTRRQRRLKDSFAARAGHARAHDLVHHEAPGNVFQFLGDVVAQMLELAAAGGAGLAGREHFFIARQMLGQWLALRFLLRWCRLFRLVRAGTAVRRCRDLFLFEGKLELIHRFGGRAEPIPAHPRKLVLQLLDQHSLRLHFRRQSCDQALQFGWVVGQVLGVVQHGQIIAGKLGWGNLEDVLSC